MPLRALVTVLAAIPWLLNGEVLPIRTYTTVDGLAADRITSIVADSRGFLWFCTPEGLSRFDGYRFVNYGAEDGLPHQIVTALLETRSGDHWIGTSQGLSRVAPSGAKARFTNYRLGAQAGANSISALLETRSGALLAATAAGLFESTDSRNFHRINFQAPHESRVTSIAEDTDGDLWIGATTGVYVYRKGAIAALLTIKDGLPGNWVEMLQADSHSGMWLALRGGVALADRRAGRYAVEKTYTPDTGLVGADVKALAHAKDGTLWIGTSQGISQLRWDAKGQSIFRNLTRAQGLSDRQVSAFAEDQAGNMWAGTANGGVMRIARSGFITYREQDGLPTDLVMSVFEDQAGELLAVTAAEGTPRKHLVNIFNGVRFQRMALKTFSDSPGWGRHQILLQSRAGEWWGATSRGLCRFGAVKAADLDGRSPRACYSTDEVFRIFEDSKGGIWASAQSERGGELMRWDPRADAIVNFTAQLPGDCRDDLVSAFAEDRQGHIWMGLYKGGLCRYNGRGFRQFGNGDGVPGGPIYGLLIDRDGRLWIASNGGGLGRVNHTEDEHPHVDVNDTSRGMVSNNIFCITDDRQGRIYAGTGKGVIRLDSMTGHLRHFSSADGLAHGTLMSAIRDRSGALWFATRQGLSRLIPEADPPPVAPHVLITDLRVGGVVYPVSQLGETRISGLQLTPSQNHLQIEFVGLDYEPGDMVRYSYRLEGADSDWSPPRAQHSVNFAAMAHGSYRFLVKAVTADGVESAAPATIEFVVLPPLWKRFEGLAIAIAAALLFAAHRYRVAQLMKIERMRTAIATDLHDDIGAGLSQIAILSEVARLNGRRGQRGSGDSLEHVAALARDLIDSMSDIVWSIRSESGGMDALIRRMREFGFDLLASRGILFDLRAPENGTNVQLSLQTRRQLFLIYKECIHNAARHSACNEVVAELRVEDRNAILTVLDNGTGMSAAGSEPRTSGGTGIPSMRRRAESLSGDLEVRSSPGHGCTITVTVPIRRTVFGKPKL